MGRLVKGEHIAASDVARLRKEFFADGVINSGEAGLLFDLEARCPDSGPEWREFFVEALTGYLVLQVSPRGYISDENAAWLTGRIGASASVNGLELLVNVIEKAKSTPVSLSAFALEQVRSSIMRGWKSAPGVIGAPEVELVRRILYGFGGDGNIAITRTEAEMLFALNDETIEAENHPLWSDLFVKGIANYLMAHAGYQVPPRHKALKREGWIEGRRGTGGFLAEMRSVENADFAKVIISGLRDIFNFYNRPQNETAKATNAAYEQGNAAARIIDGDEAKWLIDSMKKDGKLHENEKALLAFIRDECPDIHRTLKPFIARVA